MQRAHGCGEADKRALSEVMLLHRIASMGRGGGGGHTLHVPEPLLLSNWHDDSSGVAVS